eukprot:scaffold155787_cov29-Tisochrysis_lutea.AAC.1
MDSLHAPRGPSRTHRYPPLPTPPPLVGIATHAPRSRGVAPEPQRAAPRVATRTHSSSRVERETRSCVRIGRRRPAARRRRRARPQCGVLVEERSSEPGGRGQ